LIFVHLLIPIKVYESVLKEISRILRPLLVLKKSYLLPRHVSRYKKLYKHLGGSTIMLNTYRVISLSLVTALFFAAPLLCVQPISSQIKKAQYSKDKRVRVVSQRTTHNPQINTRNVSAAWARSIHKTEYKTFNVEDPLSTRGEDKNLYEDYRSDWDAVEEDGGIVTIETVSQSDL
jgi:hypothetical protein